MYYNRPVAYVNSGDDDCDGIPNIYDGYNADYRLNKTDKTADNTNSGASGFIPVDIEIPAGIDLDKARIYFAYNESDPKSVSVDDEGRHYAAPPGIRLWTKDQSAVRNPNPASVETAVKGDYIKPSTSSYAPGDRFTFYENDPNQSSSYGSESGMVEASCGCGCGSGIDLYYPYSNTVSTNSTSTTVDLNNGATTEASDQDVYHPVTGDNSKNYAHSYYIKDLISNGKIRIYVEGVSAGEHSVVFYVDPDGNKGPTPTVLKDQIKIAFVSEVALHATDAYGSESKASPGDDMILTFGRGVGNASGDMPVYFRIVHNENGATLNDPSFPGKTDVRCWLESDYDGGSLAYDPATGFGGVLIRNNYDAVNVRVETQNDYDTEWDETLKVELISWDEFRDAHANPKTYTSEDSTSDSYNPFMELLTGCEESTVSPNNGVPGKRGYYFINEDAYKTTLTVFDDDYAFVQTSRNTDTASAGETALSVSNGEIVANLRDGSVALALDLGRHIPAYRNNSNIVPIAEIETRFPAEIDWNALTALSVGMNVAGIQGAEQSINIGELKKYLGAKVGNALVGNPARTFKILVYGPEDLKNILPTGSYDMDVKLKANFGAVATRTRAFRGVIDVVNRISSRFNGNEFGNNWTLDELDRFVPSDRVTPIGQINEVARSNAQTPLTPNGNILDEVDPYAASLYSQRGGTSSSVMTLVRGDNTTAQFEMTPDFNASVSGTMKTTELVGVTYSNAEHWGFLGNSDYYGGYGERYAVSTGSASSSDVRWAEWTFDNLESGNFYQIFVSWTPSADHAKKTPFQIKFADPVGYETTNHEKTVYVDQRFKPGEIVENGDYLRSLGFYVPAGNDGKIVVRMSTEGVEEGVVSAKSIRLVKNWIFKTPDGSALELQYNYNNSSSSGCGGGFQPIFIEQGRFQLTYKNGERKDFNAHGLQEAVIDGNNNRILYNYGSGTTFGRLDSIVEQGNLTWNFSYGSKYLSSVTDFANRTTTFSGAANQTQATLPSAQSPDANIQFTFAYDSSGNLTNVAYGGKSTSATYNGRGLVEQITNPDSTSRQIDSAYEVATGIVYRPGYGHVGSKEITASNSNSIAYLPELTIRYRDPKNKLWIYQTDSYGYVAAEVKPSVVSEKDVWLWERNKQGAVTKHIEPEGGVTGTVSTAGVVTSGSLGELITSYTYPAESTYSTNPRAKYNASKIEYPIKSNGQWITETFVYNSMNLVTQRGGTAVAHTTTYEYYPGTPNVKQIKESGTARITQFTYSAAPESVGDLPGGLVVDMVEAYGTVDQKITRTAYVASRQNIGLPASIVEAADILGVERTTYYDYNKRNLSVVEDSLGRITEYYYDNMDRLIKVVNLGLEEEETSATPSVAYVYNNRGLLVSETSNSGQKTRHVYDDMGRVTQTTLVGSIDGTIVNSFQYDANGNLVKEIDALENEICYLYDNRNRLTKTIYPAIASDDPLFSQLKPSALSGTPEINYSYDVHDRLISVTDPVEGGIAQRYYYDEMGRAVLTSETVAIILDGPTANKVSQFIYNAKGQLTSEKRLIGVDAQYSFATTSYTYDTLGNLTKVALPAASGSGAGTSTTYAYDKRGNVLSEFVSGTGASLTTTYRYDKLDRLIGTQLPNGLSTLYGYNSEDELLDELSGQFVMTSYLCGSAAAANSFWVPVDLDSTTSPNDYKALIENNSNNLRHTKREFDDLGRLITLVLPDQDGTGTAYASTLVSYDYDAAGNVVQQTTTATGAAASSVFTDYDQFNRPIRSYGNQTPTTQTTYDANNNVVSVTVMNETTTNPSATPTAAMKTEYYYDSWGRVWKTVDGLDDLTQGKPVVYTFYDANGNLVKEASAFSNDSVATVNAKSSTYQYGYGNRLLKATTPLSNYIENGVSKTNGTIDVFYEYYVSGSLFSQKQTLEKDSQGTPTSYKYVDYTIDNLGQILCQSEYSSTAAAIQIDGPRRDVSCAYDGIGRIVSTTDPNENTTSYSYSVGATSTVTETVAGISGTRVSSYNVFGDLVSYRNRNNHTTTYAYDRAGNRTEESSDYGNGYVARFSYNGLGLLVSASDDFGPFPAASLNSSYEYSYNNKNQNEKISIGWVVPGKNIEYAYVYDVLGRVSNRMASDVGVSDLFTTFYDYDSLGRTVAIVDRTAQTASASWQNATTNKRVVFSHDELRGDGLRQLKIDRWEPANTGAPTNNERVAQTAVIRYNDGRLSTFKHYLGTNVGNSNLPTYDSYEYFYDQFGRISSTKIQTGIKNTTTAVYDVNTILYDKFGQMLQQDEKGESIPYDPAGNVSKVAEIGVNNRLTHDVAGSYTYDNEGNTTRRNIYSIMDAADATGSQYIYFGDHALTIGKYRVLLENFPITATDFTVKLYRDDGFVDDMLLMSKSNLTILESGGIKYIEFDVVDNYASKNLYLQIIGATISTGSRVILQKSEAYELYAWNQKNQLTRALRYDTPNGGGELQKVRQVDYRYDVFGNRIEKTISGFPTQSAPALVHKEVYVPETGHTLLEYEYDSSGLQRFSHNLYTQAIDQILATDALEMSDDTTPLANALQTIWSLTDYQNTVRSLVSRTGVNELLDERLFYDQFGQPDDVASYNFYGVGGDNSLSRYVKARYAGREFDYETKMQYNGVGYSDPNSNRWIGAGSANGDYNMYRFSGNALPVASDSSAIQPNTIWGAFSSAYGYYLNPMNNDSGWGGYAFMGGKLLGWGMFVAGSIGAGGVAGGAVVGTAAGYSAGASYLIAGGGALAGGVAAGMQTYAVNPNAGFHEYAFNVGLGGGFGGLIPTGGVGELGGSLVGGGIELASGGQFFGAGMQLGGLVGGFAGGGAQAFRRQGMKQASKMLAWQGGGMVVGGGIGYVRGGDAQSVLIGANLGQLGGAMSRGLFRYGRSFVVPNKLNYAPTSGSRLEAAPGSRTTTVIGLYDQDTQNILEELGNVKSYYLGRRPNQFNLLNIPDGYNQKTFWKDYNEPWLRSAVRRGDKIICATTPTLETKKTTLSRQNRKTGLYELTGFGREYLFLRKQGYVYDAVTRCMTKKR